MSMRVLRTRTLALRATTILFALAAFTAGCAAPAGHAALDQASAAVERARGAPRVRALAAAELDRAEMALEQARAAARAGAPRDHVEHLAYIVSQRAALAEARATERVARSELAKLQRRLDQTTVRGPHHSDQRVGASRQQDQPARVWRQEHAQASALLKESRDGAAMQDDQARAVLDENRWELASAREDPQKRAPLEQDRGVGAAVQEDRQTHGPLDEHRRGRPWGQEDRQAGMPLQQNHREGALLQKHRQATARLEQDRRESAPVRGDGPAPPVEQDGGEGGALREDRHAHARLDQDRGPGEAMQDDRHTRASPERDRRERAPIEDDWQARAPLAGHDRWARARAEDDQQARAAEQDPVVAIVEAVPQDITLRLARLPFDGAEPTSDTLEELAAVAERLLREPGPDVVIEADFDLPDPEARTVMERRVEVVRAILLRRGIEPARLVVRAAGDGPVEPPATPPLAESPD
jgi:outer membrane protein OmpA-like peptidoglycan-associated protein